MRRKLNWPLIVFCLIFLSSAATAGEKHPFSIKEMLETKIALDPQISPDGTQVAFTVRSLDWDNNKFIHNIWIAKSNGSLVYPLTKNNNNNISPRWDPDGSRLAFFSDRDGKGQIWLAVPGQGEPEKLTSEKSGVIEFAWSPDGKQIAFTSPLLPGKEEQKLKKQGFDAQEFDVSAPRSVLKLIDINSNKVTQITKGDFHVRFFSWSPDGKQLALITTPRSQYEDYSSHPQLAILNTDGTGFKVLYEYHNITMWPHFPAWNSDGQWLAIGARDKTKPIIGNMDLIIVNSKTGEIRNLTEKVDHDVHNLYWSENNKSIYYLTVVRMNSQIFKVNVNNKKVTQLTHFPKHLMGSYSITKDGQQIAYVLENPSAPPDIWVAEINNLDAARQITRINPQFKDISFGKVETLLWKSYDGLEIEGNIVKPVSYQPGKRYPLLLLVHGGPNGDYPNDFLATFYCAAHYFAGKGYLVFLPNFRGSMGYGTEFMRKNIQDWGGGDYKDIMTGIDMLIEKGLVDSTRMVVWGASYGGYMTNWIVTHSDRFKAAVSVVSLTNLVSTWGNSEIEVAIEQWFEGIPSEKQELYVKHSPLTYVSQVKTPILLIQNERDSRATVGQAKEFFRALKRHGVITKLFIYPREGHGTREPNHQVDQLQRAEAWFAKFLAEENKE